jgi:hypothetical protein
VVVEYLVADGGYPCLYYDSRDELVYGVVFARSGFDQDGLHRWWAGHHG